MKRCRELQFGSDYSVKTPEKSAQHLLRRSTVHLWVAGVASHAVRKGGRGI